MKRARRSFESFAALAKANAAPGYRRHGFPVNGAASTGHGRGNCGGTGTIEGAEQDGFPALPRDRHPSSGHSPPDMPPHHRLPAREGQRCPDRALPPGPPRNTRPPLLPVASHTQIAHRPQRPLPGRGQTAQQDHTTDPSGHRPRPAHGEGTPNIRPGAARRLTAAINWGMPTRSICCTRSPPGRAGNIRICR